MSGSTLRDTVFGDMPLREWVANGVGEPWSRFELAAACLAEGDRPEARSALEAIVARPDLESRHCLEAWAGLRAAGVAPPPMDGGARYLNFSGRAIVWGAPGNRLDAQVRALIDAGQALADLIGP